MKDRNFVSLDRVSTDTYTHTRAAVNEELVAEYTAAVVNGDEFPPVVLFDDGGKLLHVGDGVKRVAAYRGAGKKAVPAEVRQGGRDDALLYSAGCNDKHGERRSNADKRAAVNKLLDHPEWSRASDRWIAEQCRVAHGLVATVRALRAEAATHKQTPPGNSATCDNQRGEEGEKRTGSDGKQYPACRAPQGTEGPAHCDRCTRTGPVKDCPRCAELQAKAGRKKGGGRKGGGKKGPRSGEEAFDRKKFNEHLSRAIAEADKLAHQHCLVNGRGQPQCVEHAGILRKIGEVVKDMESWCKSLKKK